MDTFNLEEYLRNEYMEGKIDFSLRVSIWPIKYGHPEVYIHPTGKDGNTTPSFVVIGNEVKVKE